MTDLQINTEKAVAWILRVIENPATKCDKCRKWFNDIKAGKRGVCQAYKAQTFPDDFCLKEFERRGSYANQTGKQGALS